MDKEYLKTLKEGDEKTLREVKVQWPDTEDDLIDVIKAVSSRQHDYGTTVYAMSISALSAFFYASHVLGVTGFQAGCADMEFLKHTRNYKHGFRIIDYEKLLYPQSLNDDNFPSWQKLEKDNIEWLTKEAKKKLEETSGKAHPDVLKRWEYLAGVKNGK